MYIDSIPSPHAFSSLPLKSTIGEFSEIMLKINELLPIYILFKFKYY